MRAAVLAAVLALAAPAALAAPDPAVGEWLTDDGDARVALGPCSTEPARLCGAIVWLKEPTDDDGRPVRDVHNPDHSLRGRPVLGVLVVKDMSNAGPGRWEGGRLYDPETGKSYAGRLRALPNGRLRVDGCVLMICEAKTWTRAGLGGD